MAPGKMVLKNQVNAYAAWIDAHAGFAVVPCDSNCELETHSRLDLVPVDDAPDRLCLQADMLNAEGSDDRGLSDGLHWPDCDMCPQTPADARLAYLRGDGSDSVAAPGRDLHAGQGSSAGRDSHAGQRLHAGLAASHGIAAAHRAAACQAEAPAGAGSDLASTVAVPAGSMGHRSDRGAARYRGAASDRGYRAASFAASHLQWKSNGAASCNRCSARCQCQNRNRR